MVRLARRGVVLALAHGALVLGVAGKYAIDRMRYPSAWARCLPVDPMMPIRGRYVRLWLEVEAPGWPEPPEHETAPVALSAQDGRLIARRLARPSAIRAGWREVNSWNGAPRDALVLEAPVAFFLPFDVADPSRRRPDEELWAEVTVVPGALPRPVRLAVRRNGVLSPLPLR